MKKTAKPERVKSSGIRAVDQGTLYDIPGQLTHESRRIRECRDVTDVVLIKRGTDGAIGMRHWGQGAKERRAYMLVAACAMNESDFHE